MRPASPTAGQLRDAANEPDPLVQWHITLVDRLSKLALVVSGEFCRRRHEALWVHAQGRHRDDGEPVAPQLQSLDAPIGVNPIIDQYAVARDGQRFIFCAPDNSSGQPITVVVNWTAGLNVSQGTARVPH